jgi:hypothetical protein
MSSERNTEKWRWLFAAALALAILVVVVRMKYLGGAQHYKDDMFDKGADVATALFVITLFVERSMAVVYALIWGEAQREALLRLHQAATGDKTERKNAEAALAEELSFKERVRILLTFICGLFISAAGVRTLEGLLTLKDPGDFVYVVDVVLTAGLIAGGSNGLAWLIQTLKARITGDDTTRPERLQALLATTS